MEKAKEYPKEVIASIAEDIDAGMICFLNTDTMEHVILMGKSYYSYWEEDDEVNDEYRKGVLDKVDTWKHYIQIDPPESGQSFNIMERFIEHCIPDNDSIKNRLWNAISRHKPFQNFKFIIDNSEYRQNWFDFKQSQLEELVSEQLSYNPKSSIDLLS